jgi:hypothetical protein
MTDDPQVNANNVPTSIMLTAILLSKQYLKAEKVHDPP